MNIAFLDDDDAIARSFDLMSALRPRLARRPTTATSTSASAAAARRSAYGVSETRFHSRPMPVRMRASVVTWIG